MRSGVFCDRGHGVLHGCRKQRECREKKARIEAELAAEAAEAEKAAERAVEKAAEEAERARKESFSVKPGVPAGTLDPDLNEKIVYLTFDDGPSENTQRILDILKEYNAKATFFYYRLGRRTQATDQNGI